MAKNRTLLPGVAVSLLLHAVLIAMFIAPKRPEPQADARRMMVWLTLPAKPATPLQPVKPPPAVAAVRQPRAEPVQRPQQQPRSVQPETVAAAQPQTQAPPPTQPLSQAPTQAEVQLPADPFAAAPAASPGNFDVNAAMKSARKLATAKSTKGDPPVAQIYDKPLYGLPSDTPLGSSVARTARGDCKSVAAGTGILALIIVPVMILTDKKDSGCKW
jgi:hypothetical protein